MSVLEVCQYMFDWEQKGKNVRGVGFHGDMDTTLRLGTETTGLGVHLGGLSAALGASRDRDARTRSDGVDVGGEVDFFGSPGREANETAARDDGR